MTLGYEQVAAAADRRVELARQTLANARARFEAQIAGSNDVTRAELEVASAEREATRAHNEEQTSRLALANLLVADVPARLDVPVALLSPRRSSGPATVISWSRPASSGSTWPRGRSARRRSSTTRRNR